MSLMLILAVDVFILCKTYAFRQAPENLFQFNFQIDCSCFYSFVNVFSDYFRQASSFA